MLKAGNHSKSGMAKNESINHLISNILCGKYYSNDYPNLLILY